jgi:hypothetical protein
LLAIVTTNHGQLKRKFFRPLGCSEIYFPGWSIRAGRFFVSTMKHISQKKNRQRRPTKNPFDLRLRTAWVELEVAHNTPAIADTLLMTTKNQFALAWHERSANRRTSLKRVSLKEALEWLYIIFTDVSEDKDFGFCGFPENLIKLAAERVAR